MGVQTATHTSKDKHSCRSEERPQASARQIAGSGPHADVLDLQRAAGNRALSQWVQSSQRASPGNDVPPIVRSVLNSSGQPLDPGTRAFMEPRFSHDFGRVRVHADERAAQSARTVGAAAYTIGNDIAFGAARYAPGTSEGRKLLAHELAHVVQQSHTGPGRRADSVERQEHEANFAATAVLSGGVPGQMSMTSPLRIACAPEDDPLRILEPGPEYWLRHPPDVTNMSPTQLLDEAVQIEEWVNRQNSTSPASLQLQQIAEQFRREAASRIQTATQGQGPDPKRKRSSRPKSKTLSKSPGPSLEEKPRFLRENRSIVTTNPATLRREYDEIVAYLGRKDVTAGEREMLRLELLNLEPALGQELLNRSIERRGTFLRDTFEKVSGGDLAKFAGILDSIRPLKEQPGSSYVMLRSKPLVLSDEEAEAWRNAFQVGILTPLSNQLEDTQRLTEEGEDAVQQYRNLRFNRTRGRGRQREMYLWLQHAGENLEDKERAEARWRGLGSSLLYHGKRTAGNVIRGAASAIAEPFKQVHDLALVGAGLLGADVDESDFISGTAKAHQAGTSRGKLLLSSNWLTGSFVAVHDMAKAGVENRWDDVAQSAGGILAASAIGSKAQIKPGSFVARTMSKIRTATMEGIVASKLSLGSPSHVRVGPSRPTPALVSRSSPGGAPTQNASVAPARPIAAENAPSAPVRAVVPTRPSGRSAAAMPIAGIPTIQRIDVTQGSPFNAPTANAPSTATRGAGVRPASSGTAGLRGGKRTAVPLKNRGGGRGTDLPASKAKPPAKPKPTPKAKPAAPPQKQLSSGPTSTPAPPVVSKQTPAKAGFLKRTPAKVLSRVLQGADLPDVLPGIGAGGTPGPRPVPQVVRPLPARVPATTPDPVRVAPPAKAPTVPRVTPPTATPNVTTPTTTVPPRAKTGSDPNFSPQATAPPARTGPAQNAPNILTAPTRVAGEEVFAEMSSELGINPAQARPTTSHRQQAQDAVADAVAAGWVDQQGNPLSVGAAVQPHQRAPDVRAAFGQTGAQRQSAHMAATSLLRTIVGYSRQLAPTQNWAPQTHRAFDQHWLRWVSNRRRAIRAFGSTDFTAPLSDILEAQRQAIRQTPNLTNQQRSTYEWLIEMEIQRFASGLPSGMATRVPLPAVLGS